MSDRLRRWAAITPERFRTISIAGLVALTVIVATGAAVRLTGSGLGCHSWPDCTRNQLYAPLQLHSLIEFSNRVVGAIVGIICIGVFAAALLRRPRRRDLVWLSALLPLGVVAQAVLGGLTVLYKLSPGWVMAHFSLSMLILVGAVVLVRRAGHEPEDAPHPEDRVVVRATRALLPLAALAIVLGTGATAAGPHAGGSGTHDKVHRLFFDGTKTLQTMVHIHGTIVTLFGLAAVGTWLLARRRESSSELRDALTTLCVLLAVQGVIGGVQYQLKLPAEMVWLHVITATLTWLVVLWCVAAAGRLEPRTAAERHVAARATPTTELTARSAE